MTSFTKLTDKYLSSGQLKVPVQDFLQLELALYGARGVVEKLLKFLDNDVEPSDELYLKHGLEHILQLCAQLDPNDAPNPHAIPLPPHATYSQLQAINETLRARLRQLSGVIVEYPETHSVFDRFQEAQKNLAEARQKISVLENQLFINDVMSEPQRPANSGNQLLPLSGFKDEIIDKLIISHIYTDQHETNPQKAVNDLIAYETSTALDPLVSKEARDLIDRGRKEGVREYKLPLTPQDVETTLEEAYSLGREHERQISMHNPIEVNAPARRLARLIQNTIAALFGGPKA